MTDISKCFGKGCNKKDTCFRYLASASEYQTYIMIENLTEDCDHYWEINPEDLQTHQKHWDD